jgi:hypothetical protein
MQFLYKKLLLCAVVLAVGLKIKLLLLWTLVVPLSLIATIISIMHHYTSYFSPNSIIQKNHSSLICKHSELLCCECAVLGFRFWTWCHIIGRWSRSWTENERSCTERKRQLSDRHSRGGKKRTGKKGRRLLSKHNKTGLLMGWNSSKANPTQPESPVSTRPIILEPRDIEGWGGVRPICLLPFPFTCRRWNTWIACTATSHVGGVSCRFARCLLLPRAVLELPAGTSYFLLICSTTSTGSNVIAGLIRRGQSSRPPVRWHRQRDPRPRRLRFRCVAGPVHMGSNACVRGANATTGLLYLTGALEERIMRGTWYSTFV